MIGSRSLPYTPTGMVRSQARKPAGAPTGGQFATARRPVPGYQLAPDSQGPVTRPATIDGVVVEAETEDRPAGGRLEVYRRDGKLHDPDDGRPAFVVYRADGRVEHEMHYRDGKLHDPDGGRPTIRSYRYDGALETEEHYLDGVKTDSVNGAPAFTRYRPDGRVDYAAHMRNGKYHDPDDGSPAVVWYGADGTVRDRKRYPAGRRARQPVSRAENA